MKTTFLTLIAVLSLTSSFASQITAVTNNGDWNSNSTWDLGRIPANGDNVVIPTGKTVVIGANVNDGAATINHRYFRNHQFYR